MGVAYLVLGPLPLLLFHILYGGALLGMPRAGLSEWLAAVRVRSSSRASRTEQTGSTPWARYQFFAAGSSL